MVRSIVSLEAVRALPLDEALAFWLVRQDIVDDPHDDTVFQQWLETDPANGLAWARACAAWEGAGSAKGSEIEALRDTIGRHGDGWRWKAAIAASVALVAMAGSALLFTGQSVKLPGGTSAQLAQIGSTEGTSRVLSTPVGSRRTISLSDRTEVTLNTDTAIAVRYSAPEREVQLLKGQAYFVVSHDPDRPFVVKIGQRSVTAIGTRFEVRAQGGAMRVILVEGRVRVALDKDRANQVDLRAGQQLDADDRIAEVSTANIASVADWQRGYVTFGNITLAEAVVELNRYASGKTLIVKDPIAGSIRIRGVFHTNDLRKFAYDMAELYPVRVVETAVGYEIVSKKARRR